MRQPARAVRRLHRLRPGRRRHRQRLGESLQQHGFGRERTRPASTKRCRSRASWCGTRMRSTSRMSRRTSTCGSISNSRRRTSSFTELTRDVDISKIFAPNAPAFGTDLVCQHHAFPRDVSVLDITSHMHKRGKRFRIFQGRFACSGGPNDGAPCLPVDPDPEFPMPDLCRGSVCESRLPPGAGDCNADMEVSLPEVLTGVGIALGSRDMNDCTRFDPNHDHAVSIDELLMAVEASMSPDRLRDPQDSLLYTSITYADPLLLSFTPPMELGGMDSLDEERTLTYCAEYDNGFKDPTTVKRNSRVPNNGSHCAATHCAEGNVGAPCSGISTEQKGRLLRLHGGIGRRILRRLRGALRCHDRRRDVRPGRDLRGEVRIASPGARTARGSTSETVARARRARRARRSKVRARRRRGRRAWRRAPAPCGC